MFSTVERDVVLFSGRCRQHGVDLIMYPVAAVAIPHEMDAGRRSVHDRISAWCVLVMPVRTAAQWSCS
jgi:hypothetical protein